MQTPKAKSDVDTRERIRTLKPKVYDKVIHFDEMMATNKPISLIQMQYRYDCNMKCQHCSVSTIQHQPMNGARTLDPSSVKDFCDQADALGWARFEFNGGEPLIVKDFDKVIQAVGPDRFHITTVTNGWLVNESRAKHLKDLGVDRIQVSIDSLKPEDHDSFRNTRGAYYRARRAIQVSRDIGLDTFITTTVTRERLYSPEFLAFLEYFNAEGAGIMCTFAKPVGQWTGKYDVMLNPSDMDYFKDLERRYRVFSHLTPSHGIDMGCLAVRGLIAVTPYGDVLPCQYIFVSLGNIFTEPLKDIMDRAMNLGWFRTFICPIAHDREFVRKYIDPMVGKHLPVPSSEVFG